MASTTVGMEFVVFVAGGIADGDCCVMFFFVSFIGLCALRNFLLCALNTCKNRSTKQQMRSAPGQNKINKVPNSYLNKVKVLKYNKKALRYILVHEKMGTKETTAKCDSRN